MKVKSPEQFRPLSFPEFEILLNEKTEEENALRLGISNTWSLEFLKNAVAKPIMVHDASYNHYKRASKYTTIVV